MLGHPAVMPLGDRAAEPCKVASSSSDSEVWIQSDPVDSEAAVAMITVLTPTGTLGYGFDSRALARGMRLAPDVIAVDAGSTDPGPAYLGSAEPLCSRRVVKGEIAELLDAARGAGIPLVIGSAGGSGRGELVDWTVDIVREIARERGLRFRLAWIYADIPRERVAQALESDEIEDFEAGFALTHDALDATAAIVAQMGWEPIAEALDAGADVVVAGRACDDLAIAAYPIAAGADIGLATHMGKILECGAFSAEPFAMDVMMGALHDDHFVLEPGSLARKASLKSIAAHSLYERENPGVQRGPGGSVDLSQCRFEPHGERSVRVSGARFIEDPVYRVKLEGAGPIGFRTMCMAGIRCPTMIPRLDDLLDDARRRTVEHFAPDPVTPTFRVYGRDGVMGSLEPLRQRSAGHELGLLMDVTAPTQELAHAACHFLSGHLLHVAWPGQMNTSGNLAFPYSPSDIDTGAVYEFTIYHLMAAETPTELFPIHCDDV